MSKTLSDGTVVQGGLKFKQRGFDPHYIPYPVVGIIRKVYHLDSKDSTGISVFCDVNIPAFGIDLFQVPFAQEKSSVDNFIDYRPKGLKQRVHKKGEEPEAANDLILDTTKDDGDAVLIVFINANVQFPMIIKTLPSYHTRADGDIAPYPRYGEEKGDHYRIRMNGMEMYIDKDGNLEFKSTKTYEKTEANKKITVKLFAEKDDFDVSEDQKQSVELVIDNTKDAPKITATVTDNTSDQKKQMVEIDGTAHSTKITSQNPDGENIIELSPTGITISTIKDFTITVTENAIINVTKDATITVTGDVKVESENATVKANTKAVIDAPAIELSEGATEAVIKGTAFKSLYDAHTHPTGVGPSGPPIVPMDAAPGTHLSTIVTTG
jgi:hypothetical protein